MIDFFNEGNFPAETEGFKKLFNISDTKLMVKSRYTYSRKVEEKHKSILAEVLEIPTILYLIENIHNIILYGWGWGFL